MKNTTNPAAIQSRMRIIESCIDLMQIKEFKDITISEIAENAEVVRRTFYRNFDSKEEILDLNFQIIVDEFSNKVQKLSTPDCNQAILILLKICKQNQDYFNALVKSNMLLMMLEKWTSALPAIHDLVADRMQNFPDIKDPVVLDYLLTFNVGGTFNIVVKWMKDGMKLTPEELALIINQMTGYL